MNRCDNYHRNANANHGYTTGCTAGRSICHETGHHASDNATNIENSRQISGLGGVETVGVLYVPREPKEEGVGDRFDKEEAQRVLDNALQKKHWSILLT